MSTKFYVCRHCGNIIAMVKTSGVSVVCCGEKMQELVPNTVDVSKEKHVPVISVQADMATVSVGSIAHPMTEEHFIEWICIETNLGRQRKVLKPGKEPKAVFALLPEEKVKTIFAYCNLHGLWKAEV